MTLNVAVMLAYYFPPLGGIASDRAAMMAKLLPEYGWDRVVITPRNGFYHRVEAEGPAPANVVRTRSVELSRIGRRIYSALPTSPKTQNGGIVHETGTGMIGARMRMVAREFVYVPDAQVGWVPFAGTAAARALNQLRMARTILWSTSVPYSAHVAALAARFRNRVPWVAEFRDPWTTDDEINLPRSRARRQLDARIETVIVRSADHVVVLAESTRIAMLERHRELVPERVSVVTNGFAPGEGGQPPGPNEPLTLLYAGTVARGEDPGWLLSTLDAAAARRPGSFRFLVLGETDPWRACLAGASPPSWLELRDFVSPARARAEMYRSSVLVLLRQHAAYRMILPGKTFEYIGARRPILALVPSDAEMAHMLRTYADARIVGSKDAHRVVSEVERLIDQHRTGELQAPRVSEAAISPLSRSAQAAKLARIFETVCLERATTD